MVGSTSPHAYAREHYSRGRSSALLRKIQRVNGLCQISGVQPVYTLTHLSVISRLPYEAARDVIFDHRAHYVERKLAKRDGGVRLVYEPSPQLKSLQLAILQNCLPKRCGSNLSYAFETGSNTLAAAKAHIGARAVLKVDIRDFFGSISSRRIHTTFESLGYPKLLSLELALLCSVGQEVALRNLDERGYTYELLSPGRLPQGAPTSGKIANLVCRALDSRLLELEAYHGGTITRYADDITFSSPRPMKRRRLEEVLRDIESALQQFGFSLNRRKTRIHPSLNEFRMLGLTVGANAVWLNKHYKQTLRAHLYGLETYGLTAHASHRNFSSEYEFIEFIWGHHAYCSYIERTFADELRARLELVGVHKV